MSAFGGGGDGGGDGCDDGDGGGGFGAGFGDRFVAVSVVVVDESMIVVSGFFATPCLVSKLLHAHF